MKGVVVKRLLMGIFWIFGFFWGVQASYFILWLSNGGHSVVDARQICYPLWNI